MAVSSHEIHEKFHENTKKKESAGWNPCSTIPRPPRKLSVCSAKVVRLQRPTHQKKRKRKKTAGVLEGFATGLASLSTCSPTRVFDSRLFTSFHRKLDRKSIDLVANILYGCKSEICSAEVVRVPRPTRSRKANALRGYGHQKESLTRNRSTSRNP